MKTDEKTETSELIALDKIRVGDNVRKNLDRAKLEELAENIAQHGLLQPIIVRPITPPQDGKEFDLVAGFRRYAACELIGSANISATVKRLSDGVALEVQTIENTQREDLHPLDECDGYRKMLETGKYSNGDDAITELSKTVGKPRAYIGRRILYQSLTKEVRELFYGGALSIGHADELCRLSAEHQKAALKAIQAQDMTPRQLRSWIAREIEHRLSAAPFDRESLTLLPKAGACGACPKRTGATSSLFKLDEAAEDDRCQDPKCFDAKCTAHVMAIARTLKAEGYEVAFVRCAYGQSSSYKGVPVLSQYDYKQSESSGTKGVVIESNFDGKPPIGTVIDITVTAKPQDSKASKPLPVAYTEKRDASRVAIGKSYRQKVVAAIDGALPKTMTQSVVVAWLLSRCDQYNAVDVAASLGMKAKDHEDAIAQMRQKAKQVDLRVAIRALFLFGCSREIDPGYQDGFKVTKLDNLNRVMDVLGIDRAAILVGAKALHPMPKKPGAKPRAKTKPAKAKAKAKTARKANKTTAAKSAKRTAKKSGKGKQ